MLQKLTKWSLANRLIVLAGALVLLGWGMWQARQMGVDVLPDLAAPTVSVVAEGHGMAPEEMESQVTVPLESSLNAAPGVRRVRSDTGIGNAVVTVEFDWDVEVEDARRVVSERLQLVAGELPPEVETPVMGPISSVMGEIVFVAVSSESHSPMELRSEADWLVQQRLLSVPGVSQVIVHGGGAKQYQVRLSPESMSAYGLAVDEVLDALREGNQNVSAGFYEEHGREYLIYGLGRVGRAADIEETLIEMRDGHPLRIADVGAVEVGEALKRGTGSVNGEQAVIVAIQKQPGANTLELTQRLDEVFDDIDAALPSEMHLERDLFRQAGFIEVAVDNVVSALRDGSVLVILVTLLFLASGRATGVTVVVIPLSLLVAVVVLQALGGTINTMTLGGMVIAVGVLVDDAIVVVENAVRRLQLNNDRPPDQTRSSRAVVYEATREVISPLFYANMVVFLVFLPLFVFVRGGGAASGTTGRGVHRLRFGLSFGCGDGYAGVVSHRTSVVVGTDRPGRRPGGEVAQGDVRPPASDRYFALASRRRVLSGGGGCRRLGVDAGGAVLFAEIQRTVAYDKRQHRPGDVSGHLGSAGNMGRRGAASTPGNHHHLSANRPRRARRARHGGQQQRDRSDAD